MKYIIEIPDDVQYVLLNGKADNKYYTAVRPIAELEELTADYINKHSGSLQDEAYRKGLKDAWEAAKKLFSSMADSDIEKAFPIEWNNGGFKALMNLQPQEAIAKLKAYEDKRSDRIEVGDEVQAPRGKAIVTAVKDDFVHYFYSDGDIGCLELDSVTKTGKHYDIASILEAMRE